MTNKAERKKKTTTTRPFWTSVKTHIHINLSNMLKFQYWEMKKERIIGIYWLFFLVTWIHNANSFFFRYAIICRVLLFFRFTFHIFFLFWFCRSFLRHCFSVSLSWAHFDATRHNNPFRKKKKKKSGQKIFQIDKAWKEWRNTQTSHPNDNFDRHYS